MCIYVCVCVYSPALLYLGTLCCFLKKFFQAPLNSNDLTDLLLDLFICLFILNVFFSC